MTDRTIYCGNYRRVEDGQRLRGPLVRYEGKEMEMSERITHKRNCAAWHSPDTGHEVNAEDCTCGYRYQIQLQTEQEMHKAWRKRGEEAEVENERLKVLLDEALGNPTQDELLRHEAPWGHSCGDSALRDFLASRRSRILPEGKQERAPYDLRAMIEANVHSLCQMPTGSDAQNKAADFVLGLIAQLKADRK